MNRDKINFEKIVPTQEQIKLLFELLRDRKNSISHVSLPKFEEHQSFVEKHPYLHWFIIKKNDSILGSFYIHSDNSIGVNLQDEFNENDAIELFKFITKNYSPMSPIKSVRREGFFINVSANNDKLNRLLKQLGKKEFQISYLL